jgi:hypothetical protein
MLRLHLALCAVVALCSAQETALYTAMAGLRALNPTWPVQGASHNDLSSTFGPRIKGEWQ